MGLAHLVEVLDEDELARSGSRPPPGRGGRLPRGSPALGEGLASECLVFGASRPIKRHTSRPSRSTPAGDALEVRGGHPVGGETGTPVGRSRRRPARPCASSRSSTPAAVYCNRLQPHRRTSRCQAGAIGHVRTEHACCNRLQIPATVPRRGRAWLAVGVVHPVGAPAPGPAHRAAARARAEVDEIAGPVVPGPVPRPAGRRAGRRSDQPRQRPRVPVQPGQPAGRHRRRPDPRRRSTAAWVWRCTQARSSPADLRGATFGVDVPAPGFALRDVRPGRASGSPGRLPAGCPRLDAEAAGRPARAAMRRRRCSTRATSCAPRTPAARSLAAVADDLAPYLGTVLALSATSARRRSAAGRGSDRDRGGDLRRQLDELTRCRGRGALGLPRPGAAVCRAARSRTRVWLPTAGGPGRAGDVVDLRRRYLPEIDGRGGPAGRRARRPDRACWSRPGAAPAARPMTRPDRSPAAAAAAHGVRQHPRPLRHAADAGRHRPRPRRPAGQVVTRRASISWRTA